MKIKREAEYGVRAMVALARSREPLRSAEMLPGCSNRERSVTLNRLSGAGMIDRTPQKGGVAPTYSLTASGGKATLLEIIEASQGRLRLKSTWAERPVLAIIESAEGALRARLGQVRLSTLTHAVDNGATPAATSSGG